ncbi:MAG: hypothetical protein ACE37B_05365 [Ilumatobacter sp.]|uniref:hypothetical protein n=1 Tax=Ilumatobacter sp. TaxID=1967498 RepID=UPI00391DAA14
MNWSGDLASVLANNIVTGLPLAYLPWSIASAIAFLFMLLAMGICLVYVITLRWSFDGRYLLLVPVILVVGCVSWLTFFWVPLSWSYSDEEFRFANGMTSWQVVNGLYSIPAIGLSALLVWVFVTASRASFWERPNKWMLLAQPIAAMSGVVLGTSWSLAFAIVAMWSLFARRHGVAPRRYLLTLVAYTMAYGVGFGVMFFSPGLKARRDFYDESETFVYPLADRSIGSLLDWTFPETVRLWLEGVYSSGSVIAFATTVLLGVIMGSVGTVRPASSGMRLIALSTALMIFSFTTAMMARIGESVTYVAFWHLASSRTITLVAVLVAGLAVGDRLARTTVETRTAVTFAAGVAIIAIGGPAIRLMDRSVEQRFDQWMEGPAPISVVRDIEPESGWVQACWNRLIEQRDDGGRVIENP